MGLLISEMVFVPEPLPCERTVGTVEQSVIDEIASVQERTPFRVRMDRKRGGRVVIRGSRAHAVPVTTDETISYDCYANRSGKLLCSLQYEPDDIIRSGAWAVAEALLSILNGESKPITR